MQLQAYSNSSLAAGAPLQRRALAGRMSVRARAAAPSTSTPPLSQAPLIKLPEGAKDLPKNPGVYAVYDGNTTLQYIGLSRRVDASIANHLAELPELTNGVKVLAMTHATRESLTEAWKHWVEEAVNATGTIPPGNAPGEKKWQSRTVKPPRPEIRLTAGKGTNTPIEDLLDKVVKDCKVVAFIKGTRTQPQCGFSHKMLTILNNHRTDYEVVNVLDEVHNPGLRDAIKNYSQWPTIPQLYMKGEFIGGSDIVGEMEENGEMKKLVEQL
ncbi:thioredoxin-like protein [Dunaliella salina]|uniref:Thioredoxin-like protein n=1 Tax=Dunaliella salina TaxID=3046 RepID=A0ABQ7GFW4_DUNSA|nr:thioredoxin-like protein [Dunaliella salina]|eukprot:KAF5833488.1 thioredoxin-like protein [Dunaliella salina]